MEGGTSQEYFGYTLVLRRIIRSEMGVKDWIYLAQDRDRWVLVNAVMNLRVP
jgi:hypothetical protein